MRKPRQGRRLTAALGMFLPLLGAVAGTPDSVQPRPVTFKNTAPTLSAALAELHRQTGNKVSDRRLTKTGHTLTLSPGARTFWPTLDEIARLADARISPYQQDGSIALVDGPFRALAVDYHGIFRTVMRGVVLKRDEDTAQHTCVVHLETAWEPWFQPFYVNVGPSTAGFSRDDEGRALQTKIPGRGQLGVAGRPAVEVELRTPAPKRSAARIEHLDGALQVIGPSKMLTFTFDSLKPSKQGAAPLQREQEGVRVALTRITTQPERWTFDVAIQNPPGGPQFESYQSWLDNNRIYLERGDGQDRKVFLPQPADEEQLENITATRAAVRYHFTNRDRTQGPPGTLEDWRLVYRTPGRIVELSVPFSFKGLRLP